jgi:glyceraldehyde-3-phosphate dehydrogenase/erythrose-4-phosphate dehydrogenase
VATTKALPQYAGKFDGLAVRVPLAIGSLADLVFVTSRRTTAEEVNAIFTEEAGTDRYRGVLGVTEDPLVSLGHHSRSARVDCRSGAHAGGGREPGESDELVR